VEPRVEVWAGHQVSNGKRKIPLYGEKETHTENYFIAEVHRTPRASTFGRRPAASTFAPSRA
jgi:hypothetical protein